MSKLCFMLLIILSATATPDATSDGLRTAIARLVAFFHANPAARTPDALLGIRIGQCKLVFAVIFSCVYIIMFSLLASV